MNKRQILIPFGVLGLIAVVATVQFVEHRLDQEERAALARLRPVFAPESGPAAPESDPLDEAIEGLGSREVAARAAALKTVGAMLEGVAPKTLSDETRGRLGDGLEAFYRETGEQTPLDLKRKTEAMRLFASKVGGDEATAFFSDVLTFGSEPMKVAAARELSKAAAPADKALFEKGFEVAKSTAFPARWKATAYRRFLGRKAAEPALLELFQRDDLDAAALRSTAVELQNYGKPQVMGVVLGRLDEAGLLENSSRMPWISGKLLAKHIEASTGDELLTALRVVKRRPGLLDATQAAVHARLGDASPMVRRLVAKIIPEGIDLPLGERVLTARLRVETDPDVKQDIETSLARVREAITPP